MTTPRQRLPDAGYSIVETLVAVAVAVVVMGIAVPRLPSFWAQFQIGGAARQIAIDLQRARMKAVGENTNYRISFYDNGSYTLQSSSDGVNFTDKPPSVSLPKGVTFAGTLPHPTFNSRGILSSAASVAVTNSLNQTKTVQINILGQITIS